MKWLQSIQSKKFLVAIIAAIGMIVNDALGKPVSEETVYAALGVLGAYILGQGIADHGTQGAAKAAERAVAKGGEVARAVKGVLGAWEPEPERGEAGAPKELNG